MTRFVIFSTRSIAGALSWIAVSGPLLVALLGAAPADTAPAALAPTALASAPSATAPSGGAAGAPSAGDSGELMMFQDIPIVVAAGKREQTTSEAAASVTVIDANEIELSNYDSLAAALRNQRSFFLHTDGLNWMAGERGFLRPGEWNARILVTVDGRPTNDMIYGQSHLDRDFVVPMEAVNQIEVVRGPGSALYGTNAVFSVINVVTKSGEDVDGTQVRLEGGTQDTGRASVLFGELLPGDWDVLACVTAYDSQGDRDIIYDGVHDAAHDYGHIKNADAEGVGSAFIKVHKGDLTATFDYETRGKDNDAATYLTSFSDPGKMREQRGNVTLKYDHEIQPGESVHGMLYYGHYGYEQDWIYSADLPTPQYRYTTTGYDDWLGEEVHYDWQANEKLHLLAGADGRQSLFTHQRDYDSIDGTVFDQNASVNYWGIFTEAEYKLADWISITGGARMDHEQRIGTNASPRAAAVLSPTKDDVVKLLYGRAFRIPNLYELLYYSPGSNTPNPYLKPEIIDTYEAVWERKLADGWRATLDGYVWKMKDAMENYTYPDGSLQTRNGRTLWAHGVEVEADRNLGSHALFRAYATYTRAEHDGDRLLDSPEWIVGGSLIVPIWKSHTFLSVNPQIVGQMKTDLGTETAPTYLTNIVITSKDFIPGWDVQAGVYNLFSNAARLPRDGPFNQIQPTLNYPDTSYLVSLTHRF